MRIIILANRDLASNFALNYLLKRLAGYKVWLFLSSQVGKTNESNEHLKSLKFYEQTLFNNWLFPLIDQSTRHDSDYSKSNKTSKSNKSSELNKNADTIKPADSKLFTFKGLDHYLVEPHADLNRINTQSGYRKILAIQPDLIISIRYGVILKQPIIDIPKLGVINLHSGLLPEYQGVMATFWSMLNTDERYGYTIHHINDKNIDAGPIIERKCLPLDLTQSYLANLMNIYPAGCASLLNMIEQLSQDKKLACHEHSGLQSYYSFPTPTDIKRFYDKQLRLIDHDMLENLLNRFMTD